MYRNNIQPKTVAHLFEDFFQNGITRRAAEENASRYGHVPVNISESDQGYELAVIAPGLSKEAIKISIEKNVLTITNEPKDEAQTGETTWLRREFKSRGFKRSFTLNEKIDAAAISAKYNDGILILQLPKKETEEPKTKEINID